jgi:hypothetical protein
VNSLEQTLLKLARFFEKEGVSYMVIGGVANLFWGVPRTTLDVDITLQVEEDQIQALVKNLRKEKFRIRVPNVLGFVRKTKVLPLEDGNGIRADLIFAKLTYEYEALQRAKNKSVQGRKIRISSPEDLIIHKIISDRPRDREDVRGIIQKLGRRLNRRFMDPLVRDLAHALVRPEIWKFYTSCFHPSFRAAHRRKA